MRIDFEIGTVTALKVLSRMGRSQDLFMLQCLLNFQTLNTNIRINKENVLQTYFQYKVHLIKTHVQKQYMH